jgi:hypothetical protein
VRHLDMPLRPERVWQAMQPGAPGERAATPGGRAAAPAGRPAAPAGRSATRA